MEFLRNKHSFLKKQTIKMENRNEEKGEMKCEVH